MSPSEQIKAGAVAGQELAVEWGHPSWSDSWAELVAQTILEAAEKASDAACPTCDGPRDTARWYDALVERMVHCPDPFHDLATDGAEGERVAP